jgi:hypothetical protein
MPADLFNSRGYKYPMPGPLTERGESLFGIDFSAPRRPKVKKMVSDDRQPCHSPAPASQFAGQRAAGAE